MRSSSQKKLSNHTFTRMSERWLCAPCLLMALLPVEDADGVAQPFHPRAVERELALVVLLVHVAQPDPELGSSRALHALVPRSSSPRRTTVARPPIHERTWPGLKVGRTSTVT